MKRVIFGLAVTLAACGDSNPSVGVVVSTIDFGATDCGATAIPRELVVTNPTGTNFNFTITVSGGDKSHYLVVPPTGSVLALQQTTVTVYSQAVPAESATTDNLYGETLTVTTDLPDDVPHVVGLTQSAHGAILKFASDTVDFATPQPFGAAAAMTPLKIVNSGNADVSVTVKSSNFAFDFAPGTQMVPANGSASGAVTYSSTVTANERSVLSLQVTGPVCGAAGTSIASGTGTVKGLAAHAAPAGDRGRANSAGGAATLCVLTTTGVVACTGRNAFGMRGVTDELLGSFSETFGGGGPPPGFNQFGIFNAVRTQTGILKDVVELVAGRGFYCARTQPKDLWCWGAYTGTGRANRGGIATLNPYAAKVITGGVIHVAAAYSNICTTREPFGNLVCVNHDSGSAGSYTRAEWHVPGATVLAVSGAGGYGVLTDGTAMSFGRNSDGERGNNDPENSVASAIGTLTNVTKIVAGYMARPQGGDGPGHRFGCALETDQSLWCWGSNNHGQLGHNDNTSTSAPERVVDNQEVPVELASVTDVAAGQAHACAIIGGGVWCWGRGREGEIGDGATSDTNTATPTNPALTNAVNLGLGQRASCAVLSTGGVRCWGELAGRTSTPQPIPAFEP